MLFQRVDAADQRGFAGPGGATDHDPFPAIDRQVDITQDVEGSVRASCRLRKELERSSDAEGSVRSENSMLGDDAAGSAATAADDGAADGAFRQHPSAVGRATSHAENPTIRSGTATSPSPRKQESETFSCTR